VGGRFYDDYYFAPHLQQAGYTVGIFGKHMNNGNPKCPPPGVDQWMANGGGSYHAPTFSVASAGDADGGHSETWANCSYPNAPGWNADCYSTSVIGECSFMYRYILRESCSQFDSLPLTSLTRYRQRVDRVDRCGPSDGGGRPKAFLRVHCCQGAAHRGRSGVARDHSRAVVRCGTRALAPSYLCFSLNALGFECTNARQALQAILTVHFSLSLSLAHPLSVGQVRRRFLPRAPSPAHFKLERDLPGPPLAYSAAAPDDDGAGEQE
jgi:hypothetical protein